MEYVVRPESSEDYTGIHKVNELAFERENEAQLVDALRERDTFVPELSLVAVTPHGKVIGHVLFTPVRILEDNAAHQSLTLSPLAVHPDYQRRGIGSALVRKGLVRAETLGYKHVIVLGHTEYFARFGFKSAQDRDIRAPFPVPDANFMLIELVDGGLNGVRGVVEYPEPFEDL